MIYHADMYACPKLDDMIMKHIKPGKVVKRGGKVSGKRSKQKKAFITLKEGTIEFIQGV